MEARIKATRDSMAVQRQEVRIMTDQLNANKQEIDLLKSKLDRKEDERKARLQQNHMTTEDVFDEPKHEEIIDEEELVLLKQMKDYKKQYRDSFAKLKEKKMDLANSQREIDVIKEQLISNFEIWYCEEFEAPNASMDDAYNQSMQVEFKTNIKSEFGDSSMADEDQVTYMRAKKKVATLATAKRIEKQIGHKK